MNLRYLGDALDHWKGSLLHFLSSEQLLSRLAVDPMATDGDMWTASDYGLFARLLRVQDSQILRHRTRVSDREHYFAEIDHNGDLFLDPDTGIDTGRASPAANYIRPAELARLLVAEESRVISVYQHIRGRQCTARVDACISALAVECDRFGWCSYESATVAMLFMSRNAGRTAAIANGFGGLLGRHVKLRVRGAVNDRMAQQQTEAAGALQRM